MNTRSASVRLFLPFVFAAAAVIAAPSPAAAEAKRVGVLKFQGPAEGATRNKVMKAVKSHGFQVVGAQQIAKTASSLKVSLDTNDDFKAVAKKLGIGAFVTGEVTKKKATLTVRNGADGAVSAEASWSGPNPRKLSAAVGKNFWRRLGAAIERGKPPSGAEKAAAVAEEEAASEEGADEGGADEGDEKKTVVAKRSEDDGEKDKSESEDGDDKPARKAPKEAEEEDVGGASPLFIDATISPLRFFRRDLGYTQNLYGDVRPYKSQGGAPTVAFSADIYPLALVTRGALAGLGLTAGAEYLLPVVKTASGPYTYTTYGLSYVVGAKFRIPLGAFIPHLGVAYGSQLFQLVPPSGAPAVLPKTNYGFVRIGAGARYEASSSLSLMGSLAYLHLLGLGELKSNTYFPKATGAGVELAVAVGYRITPALELRAGADVRRYGFDFHVDPAATPGEFPPYKVAGGAVDQYLSIWAGLAITLDGDMKGSGSGAGGGSDDDEDASDKPSKPAPKKAAEEEE